MSMDISEATEAAGRLKEQGRWEEAIAAYRAITAAFPTNAVGFHNLAGTLGDCGHAAAAERAIVQAMRLGLDAPESCLVRARAVQLQGRLDESQRWYREALRRQPLFLDALRELSQLSWMRTADPGQALAPIDAALRLAPGAPELVVIKARIWVEAGNTDAALSVLRSALAADTADGRLALALAQVALDTGRGEEALAAARQAMALMPETATLVAWIDALLLVGELGRAEQASMGWLAQQPFEQHALARLATAWRLRGDERYRALYDYDAFVAVETLATPTGWSSLSDYLADLAGALRSEHRYRTHPFQQSIKRGSQAQNIMQLPHPATRALAEAIDAPIRRYLEKLGRGNDPLRARNRGSYANMGGWSIRMEAGGRHVNHIHPQGWISSACYVERPPTLDGHEGFLKLGEPGIALTSLPPAERFVEPQPGRLVLFPSYMWHGTVPFTGAGARMSFAFDLLPAPG